MSLDVSPRGASENSCNRTSIVSGHLFEDFRQRAARDKDLVTGAGGAYGRRIPNHLERVFSTLRPVFRPSSQSVGQINMKLKSILLYVQGDVVPQGVPQAERRALF